MPGQLGRSFPCRLTRPPSQSFLVRLISFKLCAGEGSRSGVLGAASPGGRLALEIPPPCSWEDPSSPQVTQINVTPTLPRGLTPPVLTPRCDAQAADFMRSGRQAGDTGGTIVSHPPPPQRPARGCHGYAPQDSGAAV